MHTRVLASRLAIFITYLVRELTRKDGVKHCPLSLRRYATSFRVALRELWVVAELHQEVKHGLGFLQTLRSRELSVEFFEAVDFLLDSTTLGFRLLLN